MGHETQKNMVEQNQNCIWIGIGVDVLEGSGLYGRIIEMNCLLVEKYGAEKNFAGSEHPHLNLYDLSVPKENVELITESIKSISEEQRSFTVKIRGINYFHFGLVFLEVEKNDTLGKLHGKIVEDVVKLKGDCIVNDYLAPHRKYNAKQKELLMQYGNPHILDQFQPHITIGHIRNQENKLKAIQEELNKLITVTEFKIDNVHIVAENEKSKETLGRFNLPCGIVNKA